MRMLRNDPGGAVLPDESPYGDWFDLMCQGGTEARFREKERIQAMVMRAIDTSQDHIIDSLLALHNCMACGEVCDCTDRPAECIGCADCREFYLKGNPPIDTTIVDGVHVPKLPSETERDGWCCGSDHYPFHYADCDNWPGLGIVVMHGGG